MDSLVAPFSFILHQILILLPLHTRVTSLLRNTRLFEGEFVPFMLDLHGNKQMQYHRPSLLKMSNKSRPTCLNWRTADM